MGRVAGRRKAQMEQKCQIMHLIHLFPIQIFESTMQEALGLSLLSVWLDSLSLGLKRSWERVGLRNSGAISRLENPTIQSIFG